MKQQIHYGSDKQQGVALPIVMVILVLSALIVLYLANTSKKEQQISADQFRTEQSISAAMAGVDWAIDYYNTKGLDTDNNDIVDFGPGADTNVDPCKSTCTGSTCPKRWCIGSDASTDDPSIQVASGELIVKTRTFFCNTTDEKFWTDPENCIKQIYYTDPADPTKIIKDTKNVGIVSIGYSDDSTASRVIAEEVMPLNPFPGGGPTTPMTSHGQITSGGNFTIINRYYNYNIWTGDTFSFSGAASKSYVRNPKFDFPEGHPSRFDEYNREMMIDPDVSAHGNTIPGELPASSGSRGNNFDVVDMDPSLNALKTFIDFGLDPLADEINCENDTYKHLFFCAFFPTFDNPKAIFDAADDISQVFVAPDGCDAILAEPPMTGVIFLTGNCALNKGSIGTLDNPALIFIDGDVSFTGGQGVNQTNIYGLLYVTGKITITGSMTVIGSALAEDAVCVPDRNGDCKQNGAGGGNGNGRFVFDPFSVNPTNGFNGLRASVPGTWRDWASN